LPVSTLAALAMRGEGPRILAAIDARMGEVYWGAFERDGDDLHALTRETVGPAAGVALPGEAGGWHGVGTGLAAGEGALRRHLANRLATLDATALPHAADVAGLAAQAFRRGETVAPEHLEPAYLRDNVALTLAEQRSLRAGR
jgi:tRNA threonylcarbamoyladenosine biosynthesis protein TsaB